MMRQWMRIVEGTLPSVTHFYHLTSSVRLDAIKQQGLVPQLCKDAEFYGGQRTAIYLSDDPQRCYDHMDVVLDRLGGEPILFMIDARHLDAAALEADDYDIQYHMPTGDDPDPRLQGYTRWQDVPWRLSLAVCGAVAYTKPIPPSALQIVS